MADIFIRRKHQKTDAQARAAAEHMASELKEDFDLDWVWEGNALCFKRPGVTGELRLEKKEVVLSIKLGLLLTAFKPRIEKAVHKYFDENFQA
ncbi:MAG: polyhydroxyalkanoic acid system family protein [Propionivibrio sp.]